MSSRILDPGTLIEPVPWRPASSGGGAEAASAVHGAASTPANHHPADTARISELENRVAFLERQIEQQKRESRDQGYQQGMVAGSEQEAAKWTDALGRLTRAIEDMSKSKARYRAEVEEDAVKLALAIARKVLNRELTVDPEALVGLARVALGKLNLRELQRVRVHPGDAPAIERMLGASSGPRRVEVIVDGTLERGGAIFESDRGMLDASVTTQLGEIERGLTDVLGGKSK